jgi:RNA polymerase sigma factor (sigma-70 family)
MHTKTSGHMAQDCHITKNKQTSFSSILKAFNHDLKRLASRFPTTWKDDFIQEGSIALFNVYEKFILNPSGADFRNYALVAIHRRMIDFYRRTIERSPQTEPLQVTTDEGYPNSGEYTINITEYPDYNTISTTFDLDYNLLFNENTLKNHSFTIQEIRMLDLHLNGQYTVSEVAEKLSISIGQASKILTKAKDKSSALWLTFTK